MRSFKIFSRNMVDDFIKSREYVGNVLLLLNKKIDYFKIEGVYSDMNNQNEILGEIIRKRRRQLGMTQEDLVDIEISKKTL